VRWFLVLVAVMSLIYRPTSDGFPSDDNETALYSANKVVGDILPQGADEPFQRLVDTVAGGGLFTTNSDPSVVGVDPLTGEDAPVGTDVGFGAGVRRYIQAGVLNGDFSLPPPDTAAQVDDANGIPYWRRYSVDAGLTSSSVWSDTVASASGRGVRIDLSAAGATDELGVEQYVPVNGAVGRSWSYFIAAYISSYSGSGFGKVSGQYLTADGADTGGAFSGTRATTGEIRINVGQIPADAAYLRVRVGALSGTGSVQFSEVRAMAGHDRYLLSDTEPGYDPGVVYRSADVTYLSHTANGNGGVDTDFPYVGMTTSLIQLSGAVGLSAIYPATITARRDDWAPTGIEMAGAVFMDADANRTITGITGGASGRVLVLLNTSAFTITLSHNDANSSAANRFRAPGSANYAIQSNGAAMVVYDSNGPRWQIVSE
jgi:hypothetical protein